VVGPRVFTIDEANELIPDLESAFGELDALRDRMKTAKVKLNALEMIWGSSISESDCPDHQEGLSHLAQMKDAQEEVGRVIEQLNELGATVKDVHKGLADVYHVREGRLVFLCWQRGEEAIEAWHHVDEGFDDRESL
jgi:hypothetical protein